MRPLGSCGNWEKSWKGSCPPHTHLNQENHQGVFGNANEELDPWKMLCSGERHPSFWNTFWSYSSRNCVQMGKHPYLSMRWMYFREKQRDKWPNYPPDLVPVPFHENIINFPQDGNKTLDKSSRRKGLFGSLFESVFHHGQEHAGGSMRLLVTLYPCWASREIH